MLKTAVVAGAVLAVALTGCSTVKDSTTTSGPITAKPLQKVVSASPVATVTALPSPSLNTTVKVGQFCAVAGTVAHTVTGAQTRCSTPNDQARPRWVLDVGAEPNGSIRPGAFCPEYGAKGVSKGKDYTCTADPGSAQGRWRANG